MSEHAKELCQEGGSQSPPIKKTMAVHVEDLCKVKVAVASPPIKKKMAVPVKDLCKEGGRLSPSIKKKMAVHVKELCKEGGSG